MDARQPIRRPLRQAAVALASCAACGLSLGGEPIRLPVWVEPGETLIQPATFLEEAPRPPRPSDENDLGFLLSTPDEKQKEAPAGDRQAPGMSRGSEATPPPQNKRPTPHRGDAEGSPVIDAESETTTAKEPRPFAAPSPHRLVNQLENAAQTARSAHSLSRLVRRYETTRLQLDEGSDAGLLDRADRVGGWAYESRGRLAAQRGDYSRAVHDFRQSLRADPANRSARHALAVSLAEAGDRDEALRLLGHVLEENPASPAARRNRATLCLALGDADTAVVDCDKALALLTTEHPERGSTLRLRGVALHAAGRLQEAAVDLNEAIRLKPSDARALVARGHVFAEGGFYEQAIQDYSDAAHADPAYGEAYRSLAWSLATCPEERLRDPETAVEAAWRARRLNNGDTPLTLDASAAAHAAAGDYAEATRLAQQLLMTAGDNAPHGAAERLRLYQAGKPFVSRR